MNILVHYPHSASGRHSFVYFVFRKLNQISIQLSDVTKTKEDEREGGDQSRNSIAGWVLSSVGFYH